MILKIPDFAVLADGHDLFSVIQFYRLVRQSIPPVGHWQGAIVRGRPGTISVISPHLNPAHDTVLRVLQPLTKPKLLDT